MIVRLTQTGYLIGIRKQIATKHIPEVERAGKAIYEARVFSSTFPLTSNIHFSSFYDGRAESCIRAAVEEAIRDIEKDYK